MRFVIAGEGEGLSDLRATIDASPHLRGRVELLGWRRDITDVYAACDLVLLTSDNEGMPLSLIEAAAAGRPSVATAVGSVPEVVLDGETGFVCAADDEALALAVLRLCADTRLRDAMGEAALQDRAPSIQPRQMVATMTALYEGLASVG